jgi:RecA-family ATPase
MTHDIVHLDDFGDIPFSEPESEITAKADIPVETWQEFSAKAGEHVPTLVNGLWPEDALGFIAAPPKKGKTWIALALAICIATGRPYLGRFRIPEPRPVLYVALEGHRAALRSRVGALTHGLGLNPDTSLERLQWSYKPRGINIADPEWAAALGRAAGRQIGAKLIIVDVLRAAARMKENPTDEFLALRHNLLPILPTAARSPSSTTSGS